MLHRKVIKNSIECKVRRDEAEPCVMWGKWSILRVALCETGSLTYLKSGLWHVGAVLDQPSCPGEAH